MAKALFGHLGAAGDPRLLSDVRRLRERVRQLEEEVARLREANAELAAAAAVERDLIVLAAEPALT